MTANQTTAEPRSTDAILAALHSLGKPSDAYVVARATGLAPMAVGQAFQALARTGVVSTLDELGTLNDLAARYQPVSPR